MSNFIMSISDELKKIFYLSELYDTVYLVSEVYKQDNLVSWNFTHELLLGIQNFLIQVIKVPEN